MGKEQRDGPSSDSCEGPAPLSTPRPETSLQEAQCLCLRTHSMRCHFWMNWGEEERGEGEQLAFRIRSPGPNPNSSSLFLEDPGGVPPSGASGLQLCTG